MPDYLENLKLISDKHFSIHKSVNKISKIFSNNSKKRKILLSLEGNTFRQLQGDKELFELVLMLLTENSKKYSNDASTIPPKIIISEIENKVEIVISSFGFLLPKEDESSLFTKGFRSKINKNSKEGTGMGLYNASKILTFFNGILEYTNHPSSTPEIGWNNFVIKLSKTFL